MDEKFMKIAIAEAKKSSERGRCGAVITRDGIVISTAHNTQRSSNDASAHAEINAIRLAGQKLGNKYLEGCTIYCTCEPCTMCLSAIVFAKIGRIVYGLSFSDMFPDGMFYEKDMELFLSKAAHKIEVVKNFMKKECAGLIH
ncbi:MAG: nucleoside deaminase [Candidatus Aenigmarchaeota archaeon]|nr:nucleoside deaminase [Candidatus Aenigmarchaeota archaeon]